MAWQGQGRHEATTNHEQASTYHNLGVVVQEQRRWWTEAEGYYKEALALYVEFNDLHNLSIVVRSMARLWLEGGLASVPGVVAPILGATIEQAEELLRRALAPAE